MKNSLPSDSSRDFFIPLLEVTYPKKVTLNHLVDIQSSFWESGFKFLFGGANTFLVALDV